MTTLPEFKKKKIEEFDKSFNAFFLATNNLIAEKNVILVPDAKKEIINFISSLITETANLVKEEIVPEKEPLLESEKDRDYYDRDFGFNSAIQVLEDKFKEFLDRK